MSDTYKIRARLEGAEFEAEGPTGQVKADYEKFLNAVSQSSKAERKEAREVPQTEHNGDIEELDISSLSQIFKQDEGIVSLKFLPSGDGAERAADAALLLIYGYQVLQKLPDVMVTKLTKGLKDSGISFERFDRVIDSRKELVQKGGQRIGARYKLNNRGMREAVKLAKKLLS